MRLIDSTRRIEDVKTKEQAQMYLATLALVDLARKEDNYTRAMLFAPTVREGVIDQVSCKRPWQQRFLDRLVRKNLIRKSTVDGSVYYSNAVGDKLLDLITRDDDGLAVKQLLWPTEYGSYGSDEDQEETTEAQQPADDAFSIVQDVAEQLTLLATGIKVACDHLSTYGQTLEKMIATLGEMSDKLDATTTKLTQLHESIERREKSQLSTVLTRVVESGARKKSLLNQLEAESHRIETAAIELTKHLESERGATE